MAMLPTDQELSDMRISGPVLVAAAVVTISLTAVGLLVAGLELVRWLKS